MASKSKSVFVSCSALAKAPCCCLDCL
jgi:hypothetical protein